MIVSRILLELSTQKISSIILDKCIKAYGKQVKHRIEAGMPISSHLPGWVGFYPIRQGQNRSGAGVGEEFKQPCIFTIFFVNTYNYHKTYKTHLTI